MFQCLRVPENFDKDAAQISVKIGGMYMDSTKYNLQGSCRNFCNVIS